MTAPIYIRSTGRYRFRAGWFGVRCLQSEWTTIDGPVWRDVAREALHESRIFSIAPAEELADLRARVRQADQRAEQQRKARALKKGDKSGFAESRFPE